MPSSGKFPKAINSFHPFPQQPARSHFSSESCALLTIFALSRRWASCLSWAGRRRKAAGWLGFLFVFRVLSLSLGLGLILVLIIFPPPWHTHLDGDKNYKDKYLIELVQQALSWRRHCCKDTPMPSLKFEFRVWFINRFVTARRLKIYGKLGFGPPSCRKRYPSLLPFSLFFSCSLTANHSYVNLSIPEGPEPAIQTPIHPASQPFSTYFDNYDSAVNWPGPAQLVSPFLSLGPFEPVNLPFKNSHQPTGPAPKSWARKWRHFARIVELGARVFRRHL